MNEHEPLTPEERALAERLRLGPQAAPSPALDAAVLAAARAAVASDGGGVRAGVPYAAPPAASATPPPDVPVARQAPRLPGVRRWSAAMGVAASLALAIGIAWQLRPLPPSIPHAAPVPAEDAAAEEPGDFGSAPAASASAAATDAAPAARAAPAPERAPPAAESRQARAETLHEPVAAPPSPMKVLSPPKPTPLPAPAVEAPPAAAPQAFPEPASAAGGAERGEQYATQPRERDAISAQATPAPVLQRRQAPKSAPAPASADAPRGALAEAQGDLSAAPPPPPAAPASAAAPTVLAADAAASAAAHAAADADARLPPRQWLARIRQQRDAGEYDAARASLRLFRQHHPQVRIPRDLRALLDD
ncbi:hypothetical protein JR065_00290 [Xanthomonas sp. AmX2]|uniref:hypothetical protein n=1 Tax=Xanthomonas sp. TaxID=29446 RepID=UPI001982151C|nr:hypothetical protein [Xanthomonas sp.]MBN6148764.1 hypothetical protein [Xanthomonas sp.]